MQHHVYASHMYTYIRYRYRFFLWTLSFLKIWVHFLIPDVHLCNTSYYVGFESCSYIYIYVYIYIYTWNPNGAPCFAWSEIALFWWEKTLTFKKLLKVMAGFNRVVPSFGVQKKPRFIYAVLANPAARENSRAPMYQL